MHLAEKAKRLFAVIILVCFFLPLAQCSTKLPVNAAVRVNRPASEVLVPAREIELKSFEEVLWVAMYVWPMAFIYVRIKSKSNRAKALVACVEAVIGCLVLWFLVQTIKLWGGIRYGGVILVATHLAYVVAAGVTAYICVRGKSPSAI